MQKRVDFSAFDQIVPCTLYY